MGSVSCIKEEAVGLGNGASNIGEAHSSIIPVLDAALRGGRGTLL